MEYRILVSLPGVSGFALNIVGWFESYAMAAEYAADRAALYGAEAFGTAEAA